MHPLTLVRRVGNTVRLAEVVQVLIKHGFAEAVDRTGLYGGLPAKVLRGLRLAKAREGPPETRGKRLNSALTELGPTLVKPGQVRAKLPALRREAHPSERGRVHD